MVADAGTASVVQQESQVRKLFYKMTINLHTPKREVYYSARRESGGQFFGNPPRRHRATE